MLQDAGGKLTISEEHLNMKMDSTHDIYLIMKCWSILRKLGWMVEKEKKMLCEKINSGNQKLGMK